MEVTGRNAIISVPQSICGVIVLLFLSLILCEPCMASDPKMGFIENPVAQAAAPADSTTVVSTRGTGRTTGHIITLSVRNDGSTDVIIAAGTYFIPSYKNYQSYVGYLPGDVVIPAGSTVDIPLTGYCVDGHKPPAPLDEPVAPFKDWVLIGLPSDFDVPGTTSGPPGDVSVVTLVPTHIVPPFEPGDVPGIIDAPGFTPKTQNPESEMTPVWPGSDTPVNGTLDIDKNPVDFAPVVVAVVETIDSAAEVILTSGIFPTPFTADPPREKDAVTQQTIWVTMGVLTGDEYEKDDFSGNVYEQFESNTGIGVDAIPEEDKNKLDSGVDQFWDAFMATGAQAKVLKSDEYPNPPITVTAPVALTTTSEFVSDCLLEERVSDTGVDLDVDIAETGSAEKNKEVLEAFRAAVEEAADLARESEGADSVDISFASPEMPASAFSLYFPHVVGARANAAAFEIDLENPANSAMTTKPIATHAEGVHIVKLTHILDPDCKSIIVGVNIAKVRAMSNVDGINSPEILDWVNEVGKFAIDFLVSRGRGTAKSLGKYLKKKVKDLPKDQAKKVIKDELERISKEMSGKSDEEIDQSMEELIKDIEDGEEDEGDEEFLYDWMAELMVEKDKVNPVDKVISDLTPEPIDFAPIKTNTYAIAKGQLDIWVEDNHGVAKSESGAQYKRDEFESKEKAEKGGGTFCGQAIRSEVTSGEIELRTKGTSDTEAAATGEGFIDTGHGRATATIESFNGLFAIAICECPDETSWTPFMSVTSFSNDDIMSGIFPKIFESVMAEVSDKVDKDINALGNGEKLPNGYDKELQKLMEEHAARAARSILKCE